MKVYTIGRSADCTIVLDDIMVSRRHALLKVYPFGKMELIDLSQNGTFLNGVKLKKNVPVPVSRKDVVKIAQTRVLDWSQVPNPQRKIQIGAAVAVVVIAVIALLIVLLNKRTPSSNETKKQDFFEVEDWRNQPVEKPKDKSPMKPIDGPQKEKPVDSTEPKELSPSEIQQILTPKPTKKPAGTPSHPQKKQPGAKEKPANGDSFSPII